MSPHPDLLRIVVITPVLLSAAAPPSLLVMELKSILLLAMMFFQNGVHILTGKSGGLSPLASCKSIAGIVELVIYVAHVTR